LEDGERRGGLGGGRFEGVGWTHAISIDDLIPAFGASDDAILFVPNDSPKLELALKNACPDATRSDSGTRRDNLNLLDIGSDGGNILLGEKAGLD
jgi:hypothetical protein